MSKRINNFFKALFNIFLFLPHFFSIIPLIKSLFSPWKKLISVKETIGFSFEEWLSRVFFNGISRAIGFILRISLILFFLVILLIFILLIPFIIFGFVILLPLIILLSYLKPSEENKKIKLKKQFVSTHFLTNESLKETEKWFDYVYENIINKSHWWLLENLLSISPLARDWAVGYTPNLDQYCEELISASYQASERHVVGRKEEIEEIEQILSKTDKANVLIVGDEGIGKHTIIDAFSAKIYKGKSNTILNYKRVLKLNLESVLKESVDQKQREAIVESLFKEAAVAGNVILVLSNFEKYISAGVDTVNLILPIQKYAQTPLIQFIGITTPYYYEKYIYHNEKLNILFPKISVSEVSKNDALKILMEIALVFEKRYRLTIPYETIEKIISKSEFYITNIPFPEKAIALLDRCAARAYQTKNKILRPEIIDKEISEITKAPTTIDNNIKQKLLNLEKNLSEHIINQEDAIKTLVNSIKRAFLLLGKRKKPLASMLFLGPTGVGKTETAKALMKTFFEDKEKLLRFDMSQYQSKENIDDFLGLLTKTIRENPYGVLLLDEVEKANKDLLNIFLTILDEGYFTDSLGEKVDCKNLIIIATSNAASNYIFESLTNNKTIDQQSLIEYLINKGFFSSEFLNRFDGIVYFKPLDKNALYKIGQKMINELIGSYRESQKIIINISQLTLENVIAKGYSKQFGARNMQRTVLNEIGSKIDTKIIEGALKAGDAIEI